MKNQNEIKNKKTLAVTQTLILVVATFAFVWLIAGTLPSVSAGDDCVDQGGGVCVGASSVKCTELKGFSCSGINRICCTPGTIELLDADTVNRNTENDYVNSLDRAFEIFHTAEKLTTKDTPKTTNEPQPIDYPIEDPDLSTGGEATGFWDYFGGTRGGEELGPLGQFSGWGIAIHTVGTLASAVGANRLGEQFANLVGARGNGETWLEATFGAAGTFSYLFFAAGVHPIIAGVAAAIVLIAGLFGTETIETGTVTFQCGLWQPVAGGENCELCNEQEIPCSEYQCKSLGKSCEFIQSDNETGEPFCYWNNRNDIDPPTINTNLDLLTPGYNYVPDKQLFPKDNGVKIEPVDGGCLSPYESIQFGIWVNKNALNNKPAYCKWATQSTPDYDSMPYFFSGSNYAKVNHSEIIKVPELTPTATGQKQDINVFVRCESLNGYSNSGEFIFNMCVDPEPDTTPPIIEATSITNGARVPYGTTEVPLEIYVNEPANCKWDFKPGVKYEEMAENFTCTNNVRKINSQILYTCQTDLTGVVANTKDSENRYYFKCQDKSEDLNTNTEDQPVEGFLLRGSEPLVIDSVSPNATTIRGATEYINITLEVKTIGGSEDGVSVCEYSSSGNSGSYSLFDETDSYYHRAEIRRSNGEHTVYIRCQDKGLNIDTESTTFTVDTDLDNPFISRAYYEDGYMKLITSEDASCVYTNFDCSYAFEDGLEFTTYDNKEHFTPWNTDVDLYVKCRDELGNKPTINTCNIVVRATNEAA